MARTKRKYQPIAITNFEPETKRIRQDRKSLLHKKRRNPDDDTSNQSKRRYIMTLDITHAYLNNNQGMVSFSPEYIQQLKESYSARSYLGEPNFKCKHCNAIFWYNERNQRQSQRNREIMYLGKFGAIQDIRTEQISPFPKWLLARSDCSIAPYRNYWFDFE